MDAEVLPNRRHRTPRPDFSQRRPNSVMISLLGIKETERYQRKPTHLPESFPPVNLHLGYLMAYLNYCDDVPLQFARIVNNIYELYPNLLPDEYHLSDQNEWLFFTMRGRKYMNETVINLAGIGGGYWKLVTGSDEPIGGPLGGNYGVCKTYCFYKGKEFESVEPSWFIEEYRLSEDYYKITKSGYRAFDDWVVCKLRRADTYIPPTYISPRVRNDPVVNFIHPYFSSNRLAVYPLLMADHPKLCIPGLFKYFAKAPTQSTNFIDEFNLQAGCGHPLIDPTCPPMVYVILLCAISNCVGQIDKGSFPVIDNMIMVNMYEINPDELSDDHGDRQDKEWFCFTIRSRKRENDRIVNCAVGGGYWHLDMAYGKAITTMEDGTSFGVRRTFEFYKGKYPGDKTSWIMYEFRLDESLLQSWKVVGDWVLCQIWDKDKTPHCKLLNSVMRKMGTTW